MTATEIFRIGVFTILGLCLVFLGCELLRQRIRNNKENKKDKNDTR